MGEETPKEIAEREARQMRRKLCKGAKVVVVEETGELTGTTYTPAAYHCQNLRRNGSAWCQACSNAHRMAVAG